MENDVESEILEIETRPKKLQVDELTVYNIQLASTINSNNVGAFLEILRSLNFCNNADVQFSANGIKYVVEESQFFQGCAYFTKEFFEHFYFRSKDKHFVCGIDFGSFIEFSSAWMNNELASLKIIYYGDERPMAFVFTQIDDGLDDDDETQNSKVPQTNKPASPLNCPNLSSRYNFLQSDSGDADEVVAVNPTTKVQEIVTEYIITTKHSNNPIDFNMLSPNISSSIVFYAAAFLEIIEEFDKNVQELRLIIKDKTIAMKSFGVMHCHTEMRSEQSDNTFLRFNCTAHSQFSYKFNCFKSMIPSIQLGTKVTIETGNTGVLRFQISMDNDDDERFPFIEFNIIPNIEQENLCN